MLLNGKTPWQKFLDVEKDVPIQPEVTQDLWDFNEQILPRNQDYWNFIKAKHNTL